MTKPDGHFYDDGSGYYVMQDLILADRLRLASDELQRLGLVSDRVQQAPSEAAAEIVRLRRALHDVISCDHHNHYDGPPPRYVQVARSALSKNDPAT